MWEEPTGKGRGDVCLPTQHDDCRYSVRGEDFPKKERKFEDNIGDVEYCQQPLISISHQMKIARRTRYDGVTNVAAVEKGKHIWRNQACELPSRQDGYLTVEAVLLTKDEEERHQVSVELAAHTSLSRLIVPDGTLQISGLMLVNVLQVEI